MSGNIVTLDVKSIPHTERSPKKILDIWNKIDPGDTLQILNDHDPTHLSALFEAQYKDAFSWEYGEKGPVDWIVNIKKLKAC